MEDQSLKGIIPRMVSTIFEQVDKADENIEFVVQVSYIEIYMEKIRDLLDSSKQNLQVRQDKAKGIYIEGCTEVNVGSEEDVMNVMRAGQANRAVAFTLMNAESSRSHSLFIVKINQRNTKTNSVKNGRLYLVDLAGSEKVPFFFFFFFFFPSLSLSLPSLSPLLSPSPFPSPLPSLALSFFLLPSPFSLPLSSFLLFSTLPLPFHFPLLPFPFSFFPSSFPIRRAHV